MTYKLAFHPQALKEWEKLNPTIKKQFKSVLKKRLEMPRVPSSKLHGPLSECYKIKLRDAGYRLVYEVNDDKVFIMIVAVGKRDKNQAYGLAEKRIKENIKKAKSLLDELKK